MRMTVNRLLEKMVPDAGQCREAAERLRAKHPGESPEQLARRAIAEAQRSGVTVGALTGVATNPLAMVPAALADMAVMLRIEGVMAGTIAALIDPDSLADGVLAADVSGVLFPGAVSQALRQVGVRAGEQATKRLVRKYATEDLLKLVVKIATRHLGFDITRNAIVEKSVPLVGSGIGAGWNWLEVAAVGNRAIRYYKGETLGVPGGDRARAAVHAARSAAGGAARRVKKVVSRVTSRRKTGLPPPALPGA
jgi:hypothetical protein